MDYIFSWYLWMFPLFGIFACMLVSQKNKYVLENCPVKSALNYDMSDNYRVGLLFSFIVFLPMLLIAANRAVYSGGFGDTMLYVLMYNGYPESVGELSNFLTWEEKDTGFIIFSTIVKQIFGVDYQPWLFIIAFISVICLVITYRRYTSEIVLCAFLFFVSTDFHSWMMNGMRQFLVTAILFALFPVLKKRNAKGYLTFIIATIVLYTFHSSCLVVLPMYYVAFGKAFNKKTISLFLAFFLAIVFLDQFTNLLDKSLESTHYSDVTTQMETDDGTSPLRVLMYSIPTILAFVYRKKLNENTPEIINISINMSTISTGLYVLAMVTSGIYIGRLPIYFSLFNYILLPWEIKNFIKKESRNLIYGLLFLAYIIFFFYQMYTWNFGYIL